MAKFRLLTGHHACGRLIWSVTKTRDPVTKEITGVERPVLESNLDLARMFVGKFERVNDYETVTPGRPTKIDPNYQLETPMLQAQQQKESSVAVLEPPKKRPSIEDVWPSDDEDDDEEESVESELGEDVSYVFAEASMKALNVFKSGNKYNIARRGDPNSALEKPLSKKQAREWIAQFNPDAE